MNTRAKVAVISVLIGMAAIAWSIPSWAHDRSYHHDHYRDYYRHYHHNHQRRRSDNDDWAWAVGGLILGGIIANSDKNRTESSVSLPPPQRRVQTCYDEVAYDQYDKPYVLRRCVETVE